EAEIGGKWLEILKEVAPAVTHAVVLLHTQTTANVAFLRAAETASTSLGITVTARACRMRRRSRRHSKLSLRPTPGSSHAALRHGVQSRLDRGTRQPPSHTDRRSFRFMAASGSLVSYGVDVVDLFRRGASDVDRMLRGAKPADLPVQAPTKYELVVNLKTA